MASASHLPLIGPNRRAAEMGALIGYRYDGNNAWRALPPYIDRTLNGAKPSDLPIEQSNKLELVVNLKTAKALHRDPSVGSPARSHPRPSACVR